MQMRAFVVGAALSISLVGVADAADMAVKAPRPAPVLFSWTGCYVGVNAGGAWGRSDRDARLSPTATAANPLAVQNAQIYRFEPTGFTGGGQIGCNYQTGNFVIGVEGDVDYLGLRSSRNVTLPFPNGGTFSIADSMSTDWMATVRGRIGYAANNWLFYATGGLAVTELRFNHSYFDVFAVSQIAGLSDTRYGWTAGAGVEVAIGGGPWSAKLEYLHADFGSASVTGQFIDATGVPLGLSTSHSVDLKTDIVRAGLNYRFGGGTPVVAKY
jgi:outer membrane immunogenic protein